MAVAGTVTHEGPVPIQVSYIVTAVLGCMMRTGILGLMRTGILYLMRTGIRHIFSKCESMVDARHTKVRITHQCVLSTLCSARSRMVGMYRTYVLIVRYFTFFVARTKTELETGWRPVGDRSATESPTESPTDD